MTSHIWVYLHADLDAHGYADRGAVVRSDAEGGVRDSQLLVGASLTADADGRITGEGDTDERRRSCR